MSAWEMTMLSLFPHLEVADMVPDMPGMDVGGAPMTPAPWVAFMAYCLQVTLKHRLRALAPGLTPRAVLEKFAAMQMVDVHVG